MPRETPPEGAAASRIVIQHELTGPTQQRVADLAAGSDPDGVVQALARRDGSVILRLICGDSRTTLRLDVCGAAQLSTRIWEAAGAAQQLTFPLGSGVQQAARQARPHRSAPLRRSAPGLRSRPTTVTGSAALEATRITGLRIRRIRQAQGKSLQVIAGLAGMSTSTLHRVEHGQRELTLCEIVALARALEIAPAKLIRLPILAPTNGPSD